jgi:hypothetical protein
MSVLIWVVAGALTGVAVWAWMRWNLVRPLECATAGGFGGFLGGSVTAIVSGRPVADLEALSIAFAVLVAGGLVVMFGGIAERDLPATGPHDERLSSNE